MPKRLKEAREAAGLSQEKLSELVGIEGSSTRSRMSNYEVGRFAPSFEFVCRVAEVLGYPEYYFYVLDDVVAQVLLDAHRHKNKLNLGSLEDRVAHEYQRLRVQRSHANRLLEQLNHDVRMLSDCLKG